MFIAMSVNHAQAFTEKFPARAKLNIKENWKINYFYFNFCIENASVLIAFNKFKLHNPFYT